MVKVDKDDLLMSLDMVASGEQCGIETLAYVCTQTGKVWITGFDDDSQEELDLPSDLHDSDQYIMAPDKADLGLGRDIAISFAKQNMPNDIERVYGFFRRQGAYSSFKHLLTQQGLIDDWYQFEEQQTVLALANWCKNNDLTLIS